MSPVLTTLALDIYLVLLAFQGNGILELGATSGFRLIILAFLMFETVCILVFKSSYRILSLKVNLKSFLSSGIIYMLYILAYLMIVRLPFSMMLEIMFFPLCIVVTYVNYNQLNSSKKYNLIIDIQFYTLFVLAAIFFMAQIQEKATYETNINAVYYLVFTLPFIISHKNRIKRGIGIAIIVLCVFWSMKRAPLIALGAVFLLIYRKKHKDKKSKLYKFVFRAVTVFLIVLILDFVFVKYFDINMLDRMSTISTDGGSGRIDLANYTIEELKKNNLMEWLFGHMLASTSTVFVLGAHNDFLEVTYRMGLVGLVLFLNIFRTILNESRKCRYKRNYKGVTMINVSLILFLIISFSSQLIYLPAYIALIAMSVNLAVCRNNIFDIEKIRMKKYKLSKNESKKYYKSKQKRRSINVKN